ncbi:MAG: hypothetical protein AMXMBFR13_36700 [Phycisphaerae bacterium]
MAKRKPLTDEQRAKQRADYREYYHRNRERILAARRANRRPLTDEQRERLREYNRRYFRNLPPEKAAAQRQKMREWREANRDELNRRQREKLAALPEAEREAFRAKRRAYYRRNRERILERQRQYQYSHPEQVAKAIQRSAAWHNYHSPLLSGEPLMQTWPAAGPRGPYCLYPPLNPVEQPKPPPIAPFLISEVSSGDDRVEGVNSTCPHFGKAR